MYKKTLCVLSLMSTLGIYASQHLTFEVRQRDTECVRVIMKEVEIEYGEQFQAEQDGLLVEGVLKEADGGPVLTMRIYEGSKLVAAPVVKLEWEKEASVSLEKKVVEDVLESSLRVTATASQE